MTMILFNLFELQASSSTGCRNSTTSIDSGRGSSSTGAELEIIVDKNSTQLDHRTKIDPAKPGHRQHPSLGHPADAPVRGP